MRHIITLALMLVALVGGATNVWGTYPDKNTSDADRAKWMQEMQQHQNDFIAKELLLTDKQKADFLPVYNKMRSEVFEASKDVRKQEQEVRAKGDAATDADYERATKAYLEFRTREAQIIHSYYKKFGHILSKKQLFKLDSAERKFDRKLMQVTRGKATRDKRDDRQKGATRKAAK
ncbi:MAG: Spy/CpxP family protein refolding chaperone [Candidatus Amulumruptor sp.]|nr:Spy/CpxP family protein refolding chaperone [Candidatus Amulumruptor sp.]MDE7150952.1 Spy/CpxP family protein refolding chaperone [Candidatus Amulumruptor sp.]MDE7237816.1 Spy/CpxP family protein refolding chaperone [Paramuribaculum sp.]